VTAWPDPVTADATTSARSSAPKSTTAKTLWSVCVVLLVTTIVVLGTSLWVFRKVHGTVGTVRTNTAPAMLEVLAAQEALVKADSAAISSFQSGEVKLSGPGLQHQNQLTVASQSLAQVAEHNAAGPRGSQRIQLLEGLLESYSSLVGQAHAHFGTAGGTADLWSASRLMDSGDGAISAELDKLLKDETQALNDQIASSSTTTGVILVWVTPIAFLFVMLAVTQVFVKRRFHRAVNPSLLLAMVVLAGLSIVTSLALVSQHGLESTRDTLDRVVLEWQADTLATDMQRQRALERLVTMECSHEKSGCGPTVDRFAQNLKTTGGAVGEDHDKRVAAWISDVDRQIGPAAGNARLWFLIPLTAALVAVLIPLGLWPRIEEYRYRPR
jgi:hypothetical protein